MNSGTTQVLNILIGLFLGRLLLPEEYAPVGVLAIFTAIAGNLQSSGFTQGLVNMKRPADSDYNAVFTFNVVSSVIIYAVLFACAPLIALFFNMPCLTSLSRFVFLGFLIASFGIAHNGYMTKNMMNREIVIVGFVALVVSGAVAIVMALNGMSYWSLAWQQVLYITILNIGRYFYTPWRPRLTRNMDPVKRMFRFSVKILITNIINTISNNCLTVVFGRICTPHVVGNFTQAYKWDTMAYSFMSNTVGQVAQTVLVESGDEEGRELRVYRKMIRFTCLLAMPILLGLAFVAEEFIYCTVGEQWLGCVPMLRALCLSGAFMPLYTMYQNLAISQGRSDIYMRLNVAQIVLQIAVILLLRDYGMMAMVGGYSAFMVVWLLPWHVFAGSLIRYRWTALFADVMPFLLTSAGAMLVSYALTAPFALHPVALLLIRVPVAVVAYYAVLRLCRVKLLRECEQFFLSLFRK